MFSYEIVDEETQLALVTSPEGTSIAIAMMTEESDGAPAQPVFTVEMAKRLVRALNADLTQNPYKSGENEVQLPVEGTASWGKH